MRYVCYCEVGKISKSYLSSFSIRITAKMAAKIVFCQTLKLENVNMFSSESVRLSFYQKFSVLAT